VCQRNVAAGVATVAGSATYKSADGQPSSKVEGWPSTVLIGAVVINSAQAKPAPSTLSTLVVGSLIRLCLEAVCQRAAD